MHDIIKITKSSDKKNYVRNRNASNWWGINKTANIWIKNNDIKV